MGFVVVARSFAAAIATVTFVANAALVLILTVPVCRTGIVAATALVALDVCVAKRTARRLVRLSFSWRPHRETA